MKQFIGVFTLAVLLCSCGGNSHEVNARNWAHDLGIENPKINCDPGMFFAIECGCTVKYTDESKKERLVRVECCGNGCVMRPGGSVE